MGEYCTISASHKGSTKREFLTNVSHKFGIKSFHSHTYKSTKWIKKCKKYLLIVSGPFLSLVTLPKSSKGFGESSIQTFQFSSVQSIRHVLLFATPRITAHQASLSITNSWSLHKLMSIELVMPFTNLILCHPLLLLSPIPPSITVKCPSKNIIIPEIQWQILESRSNEKLTSPIQVNPTQSFSVSSKNHCI